MYNPLKQQQPQEHQQQDPHAAGGAAAAAAAAAAQQQGGYAPAAVHPQHAAPGYPQQAAAAAAQQQHSMLPPLLQLQLQQQQQVYQEQQEQAPRPCPAGVPGLMGLLAARRQEAQQQQKQGPERPLPPTPPGSVAAPPHLQHAAAAATHVSASLPLQQQPQQSLQPQPLPQQLAPAGPSAAGSSAAQQPQQQPQHQPQPPPQQQAAAAPLQGVPRRSLQDWKQQLASDAQGTPGQVTTFNLGEAKRWLRALEPHTFSLLDATLHQYFDHIHDNLGPATLSCAFFFPVAHSDVYRGASRGLRLTQADHPTKVLNQRISFYRARFIESKRKAEALASILAHRPDVAKWLPDDWLQHLFDDASEDEALTALAALALLPEGWAATKTSRQTNPGTWMGHYLTAVTQDPGNAEQMVEFIERQLAAAAAITSSSEGSSSTSAANGSATAASLLPNLMQQQLSQQPALQGTPAGNTRAAGRSSTGSSSTGRGAAAMTGPWAAAAAAPPPPAPAAAPPAVSAANSCNADANQMGLVQLAKDRPDVVRFMSSELQKRIKGLPTLVALQVLGTLNDLPSNWSQGQKQPMEHVAAVASKAVAHAQAAQQQQQSPLSTQRAAAGSSWGEEADDDDYGWAVVAAPGGGTSSSSTAPAAAAAGGTSSSSASDRAVSAAAAWSTFEQSRIAGLLSAQHKQAMKQLAAPQQVQLLEGLARVTPRMLAGIPDCTSLLSNFIHNMTTVLTRRGRPQLQAALLGFQADKPQAFLFVDDELLDRLYTLPLEKALNGVEGMRVGRYWGEPDWHRRTKNPTTYLMGMMRNALNGLVGGPDN